MRNQPPLARRKRLIPGNFPFLSDENVGDLLILCKISTTSYKAYVLGIDEDIENFFVQLNMTPIDTNRTIPKQFELTRII